MKITGFEILTVEIPMRMSVEHTLAKREVARNILVKAVGEDGLVGWGESCPRPYVTGETVDSVKKDLSGEILPEFNGKTPRHRYGFNPLPDIS